MNPELEHLFTHRNNLYHAIRDFFSASGYIEVETPILVASPDISPSLTPFETNLLTVDGQQLKAGLITSPEFSMKKLLGQGMEKIFTITKVFRNSDFYSEGPSHHNPEFTMLEWYEQGMDYRTGMDQTEALVKQCAAQFPISNFQFPFLRLHLPTAFREITSLELCDASEADLLKACERLRLGTHPTDTWSDLFHRIFLTQIETRLPAGGAFVYDFPLQQAALARTTPDGKYAERFELYLGGAELCNAFGELTDTTEQRRRFEEEQTERRRVDKTVFPIDEELLALLPSLRQPTFGNALGLDRLLMILLKKQTLDEILAFPAKKLFR